MGIIKAISNLTSFEGFVKITVKDAITGETQVLPPKKLYGLHRLVEYILGSPHIKDYYKDLFGKNTATYDARRVAAHLLTGDTAYAASFVEWGWGNTPATRNDTDLDGAFDPRVTTPILSFDLGVTPEENVVKITSKLTTETLNFPIIGGPPSPPYPYVRELGLRTAPIAPTDPDGILIARYVLDADQPKTVNSSEITVEWLYVYN